MSTNAIIHFTKYLCLNIYNDSHDHTDWFAQDSPIKINITLFHFQKYLRFDDKLYGYHNNEKLPISSQVLDS